MRISMDVGTKTYGEKYQLDNYVLEITPFYRARRNEEGEYIHNERGKILYDVVGIGLTVLSKEKSEISGASFTLPINVINKLYSLTEKWKDEIQNKPIITSGNVYMRADERRDEYSTTSAKIFRKVLSTYRRMYVR